jgi:UDP-glucose 4-epimerase
MIAWVLGRGGLVGSSVEAKLLSRSTVWAPESGIQWNHKFLFENTFRQAMEQFTQSISNDDWAILWCAGNNVVSSSFEDLRREGEFIAFICLQLSLLPRSIQSRGLLSFTSSAGGVYGGSSGIVFNENTIPRPANSYGHAKLETEQKLINFANQSNTKVAIFRIANVYGPNQDTEKPQGIISAITHSLLHHKPVNIYVPLQTIRNYIYADDVGEVIARSVTQLAGDQKAKSYLKVVASDRNISLSSLINEFRLVYGHRPMVVNSVSKVAAQHPVNLRLQSIVEESNPRLSFTPLAVGIDRVRGASLVGLSIF